jgi:hypothetical protein
LAQEGFDDQYELAASGQDIEVLIDDLAGGDTVRLVERNIDVQLAYLHQPVHFE